MAKTKRKGVFGPDLSFAASESFKLLRVNIDFCVPDEGKCRVIGINSSLRSEGKSTTSMNIAYMMAEIGRKVLLVEADMRLPSICEVLDIPRKEGLSNVLAGLVDFEKCIQPSGVFDNFNVLAAGAIPPNPSELLGSKRMDELVKKLKEDYDIIIFDMPPVNEVSDSLVMARFLDGMLMVVRKDYCFREALAEAMYQIELSNVNLIGFVMTRTTPGNKYAKKYGGKYYGRYGYGQGKSNSTGQV